MFLLHLLKVFQIKINYIVQSLGLLNLLVIHTQSLCHPREKTSFKESITGTFSGVGMEVGVQDGFLTVIAPLKNSPAEKAGIETGDKIVSINDVEAGTMKVEEAVQLIRGEKRNNRNC
jgi:carboxyl-terminal processing protease